MRAWWRRQSVRTRLAWMYAATVAVVLLTYSAAIFTFVTHVLNSELNDRLHDDFEFAEESLQVTDAGVGLLHPRNTREHDEQQPWVEIWEPPATIRFRTPRAGSAMLDDIANVPENGYRLDSLQAANGERLRSMIGLIRTANATYAIRVARSEEPLRHELRELLIGLLVAVPLAIGLSKFVGAQMARRALRPVELMADHARSITAERLHDRLPVENTNDELGQLATVFNETLARLDRSFDQLRRFTADASHELRTPLTALRSVGEVGLSEPHDPEGYRDIIGSMLEDAERLTRLVESLLILSRADAGQAAFQRETLDLSNLASEVVNDLCVLAEEKRQLIQVVATRPVFVSADRVTLTQALVNLLDNAIKFSPDGAEIVIEVSIDGEAHVDVTDRGPGISPDHGDHIFDRFYRVDPSRTSGNDGVGLGLSIAKWAVQANRGRLTLQQTGPSGSTFRISLPAVESSATTVGTVTPAAAHLLHTPR